MEAFTFQDFANLLLVFLIGFIIAQFLYSVYCKAKSSPTKHELDWPEPPALNEFEQKVTAISIIQNKKPVDDLAEKQLQNLGKHVERIRWEWYEEELEKLTVNELINIINHCD